MPTTIDDLASSLQQFFASKFPLGGDGGAGSLLLIFDPLGFPLSTREFLGPDGGGPVGDLLAHQRAAELADQLPSASSLLGGTYLPRGGSKLSRWYRGVVDGSSGSPADGAGRANFDAAKVAAQRALSNNELVLVSSPDGSTQPAGTDDMYYSTSMVPVDWFADESDVWQVYKVDAGDDPPQRADPPWYAPKPPIWYRKARALDADPFPGHDHLPIYAPSHPELTEYVRIATEAELQTELTREGHLRSHPRGLDLSRAATIGSAVRNQHHLQVRPLSSAVSGIRSRLLTAISAAPPVDTAALENDPFENPSVLRRWRPSLGRVADNGVSASGAVLASTTSARPSSSKFSVQFDYCLVRFDRPWWDDMFLSRRDWQLSGYGAGELSSGKASQPKDPLTLVTVGMLVVKNLAISANWSDADLATLPRSTSLGPFCIAASTFHSGSLARAGHQVIAWLCQVPPSLPPL
ncbi:hypothetical protein [Rhizobium mesosinicum]|uniref:DUF1963 domain-containing protein n=1 Tax=Rhizobium mesosinicum TaxID=335017 RepID=A0ABS7GN25_9HYPH|nr:hypothetical protein [Rhizobium mesosinicum]MBW9051117.1 hypothetical protein [Rhizobium mesosinicum]